MQFQNPCWKTSDALEKIAALNSFSSLLCLLGRGSCRRSGNLDVDSRTGTTDGWYHLERTGLWPQTTSTSSCVTAEQQLLQLRKKDWSSSRQIPPRTVCLGRLTEKQKKMSHLSQRFFLFPADTLVHMFFPLFDTEIWALCSISKNEAVVMNL